ncbi:MAG: Fe(3+)-hydroxamate ABC transporter permease FhuB [Shinella sp.]|nr:Fe(3+)-hydroxamate ABC transporter permease FhuB [Shinella sp.]
MAFAATFREETRRSFPFLIALAVLAAALCLLLVNVRTSLPQASYGRIFSSSGEDDLAAIAVRYGLLPRFTLSLLAGAALGLSGVLFQQVLRNPLAEPGTLGIFAGAKCALASATLWLPGLLVFGQEPVILAGGLAVLGLVLLLTGRMGFSPLTMILGGLIVSLCLEAASSMLFLVHFEELSDLLTWQAGSLVQNNWDGIAKLLPSLVIAVLAALLRRPMTLLDLDEAGARSAGVSVTATRLTVIGVAAVLSALVVAVTGVIGFVGLAGPAVARLAGARRLSERLIYGPLIAAGMLALTDQLLLVLLGGMDVPAGAVTALLGTPLLIWLIRKVRPGELQQTNPLETPQRQLRVRSRHVWFPTAFAALAAALLLALLVGREPAGWHVASIGELQQLMPWRLPRIAAAAAGGLMLAVAGTFMQRLTGNGLASPELLGISSGAALILMVAVFFLPPFERDAMMLISAAGAFAVLNFTLWLGRRSSYRPEQMLLTGVALGALAGSLSSILVLLGDIRILRLLGWLAGSTYSVTARDAWVAIMLAALSLAVIPFFVRWLRILPLGGGLAVSIGLPIGASRLTMMLFAAVLTGAATLLVGPLSFAGLAAPHLARVSGLRTPLAQICGAALLGALIMILADWAGRTIAFPWQIPAGIVATLLGGAYFILLAMKR